MEAVEKELDKVFKRQKLFHSMTQQQLDSSTTIEVESAWDKVHKTWEDVQTGIKEYYSSMSKLSKAIDKRFTGQNLEQSSRADVFDSKERLLDEITAQHFLREGKFQLVDTFSKEANLNLGPHLQSQFSELFLILESLRSRQLDSALNWAQRHRELLERRGSHLEFKLHQLKFLALLHAATIVTPGSGSQAQSGHEVAVTSEQLLAALTYAKSQFRFFGSKYLKDIQRLMGSLLYTRPHPAAFLLKQGGGDTRTNPVVAPLLTSPYADLFDRSHWVGIESQFTREFCHLLGMSQDPPLAVCVNVGAAAIPTMIKLRTVMEERRRQRPKMEMWSIENELPVEIPLPRDYRYHSIFACPVSREQTTHANPPIMLPCGHVISRESVLRLAKGSIKPGTVITPLPVPSEELQASCKRPVVDLWQNVNTNAKFKCPYCPTESTVGQTRRIYF